MKNYIVVDLETTGFSARTNEIIEIGAYKVDNGVVVDKFNTFVKPVMHIPQTVTQITGITMEDVSDAEPIDTVILEFFDWSKGYAFLGHNLRFDYDFLCYAGKLRGVDFTMSNMREGICTLKLSRKYLKLADNSLSKVAHHLGINLKSELGYHRASYDAMVTKLVYEHLLEKFKFPDTIMASRLDDTKIQYGEAVLSDVLKFE